MNRILCLIMIVGMMAVAKAMPADTIDTPRVSLLTCAPGPEVYELCGHTGLRIKHDNGLDYVVNYGLFDFDSPNFLYRFVKGETDYQVGAHPAQLFIEAYRDENRGVTEQVLDMMPEQAVRLEQMLMENMQPSNRIYRYNYVKDNCATRPLDMIERALGDTLTFKTVDETERYDTFREEMMRFHANYPWYQLGIDLALGSGVDYPVAVREKAFAPVALCAMLAQASVDGRPVVKEEKTLIDAPSATLGATPWYATPTAVFWTLFALALALHVYDVFRHKVSRWFDTAFFAVCGIVGTILCYLVFFSLHEATSPNWLLVALNPLCFAGAVLPWVRDCKLKKWYFRLNFWAVLLLIMLWPFTDQHINGALLPLAMIDIMRSGYYVMLTKTTKY